MAAEQKNKDKRNKSFVAPKEKIVSTKNNINKGLLCNNSYVIHDFCICLCSIYAVFMQYLCYSIVILMWSCAPYYPVWLLTTLPHYTDSPVDLEALKKRVKKVIIDLVIIIA